MYMYNYVEMARVTGVPMGYLLTRGQSIKVRGRAGGRAWPLASRRRPAGGRRGSPAWPLERARAGAEPA
jgi:hypothetical protein